jgi:nucleoside-diphosphate-sugar epimerase
LKNYADSKTILKNILIEFSSKIQIDSLRLEHPYGEHDSEGKFISMLINDLMHNKERILFTSGSQKRDFIYVWDVVEAFIKILENEPSLNTEYSEYEVGTGNSISVREFVESVASVIKSDTILDFGALPSREGEILDSSADTSKLKELGWSPKFNIESAVKRIISVEQNNFNQA